MKKAAKKQLIEESDGEEDGKILLDALQKVSSCFMESRKESFDMDAMIEEIAESFPKNSIRSSLTQKSRSG